jgi:16S rRNA (cytosine967-C5)-methyltransferase
VSAACNTSVELAKRYGHQASSRFVNAVLRNAAKNIGNLPAPSREDLTYYLSVKYSHPEWLVKRFLGLFGEQFTEELLRANNETADFAIRVNTLKTDREELISKLAEEGIQASEGRYLEEAVVLKNPSSISRLQAFKDGLFQVQDESSMLCASVLSPQKGDFVIDVCSAPGGKSTHMAQLMKNSGTIIARDIHPHKLRLIDQAAERLGIDIIKTQVFDACELDESLVEKADKVLVDAPCTGLGIIRKKPDIKYARLESDITEIKALQLSILSNAARYVKPGGSLVYSTCTVLPEENLENVRTFLSKNKDFSLTDISGVLPEVLKKPSAVNGYIELFPNTDGVDGFFISKMRKE